jgi:hypothetical protein
MPAYFQHHRPSESLTAVSLAAGFDEKSSDLASWKV